MGDRFYNQQKASMDARRRSEYFARVQNEKGNEKRMDSTRNPDSSRIFVLDAAGDLFQIGLLKCGKVD
jgi:hypothetical protein